MNTFLLCPGTSSSYLGNNRHKGSDRWWYTHVRRSPIWGSFKHRSIEFIRKNSPCQLVGWIHPKDQYGISIRWFLVWMMVLWWQQIRWWTLSEDSINQVQPIHQSIISNEWIIDESIWQHSGVDASSSRCGHVLKWKKKAFNMFIDILGVKPPLQHTICLHRLLTCPISSFQRQSCWILWVSKEYVDNDTKSPLQKNLSMVSSCFKNHRLPPQILPLTPFQGQVFAENLRGFPHQIFRIAFSRCPSSLQSFFGAFFQNGFWLLKSAVGATSTSNHTVRSNYFRWKKKLARKLFHFWSIASPKES